jgi:carboxyl-terminal processing protease
MTKTIKIICHFIIFFLTHGLAAQAVPDDSLTGIWQMRGYGKIIAIDESTIATYEVTAISCTLSSQVDRDAMLQMGTFKKMDQNLLTLTQGIKIYTLDKVDTLPKRAKYNQTEIENPAYNFDVFWNTLNENYPFFATRQIDWPGMKEKYRSKGIKNKTQLQRTLKKIIRQLNDGHTTLIVPKDNGSPPHYATSRKTAILEDKILGRYVKHPVRYGTSIKGNGLLNYGITENNVGYIQVNNMMFFSAVYKNPNGLSGYDYLFDYLNAAESDPDHFEEEKKGVRTLMAKLNEDLKGTDAIILDLRFNSGGYDLVSLEILRHFISEETKLYSKKAKLADGFTAPQYFAIAPASTTYTKPVFLLTSHQTASAPEIAALGSLAVSNITRIGSNTEGIFSDILEKKLPNGWILNLSNEIYQDTSGTCYESMGIPPDIQLNYPEDENAFIRKLKKEIGTGDRAIDTVFKLIEK